MGRIIGSKNKIKESDTSRPLINNLPLKERLRMIANLVVDQIIEAQKKGLESHQLHE